jgi:hypothetical protein
MNEEMHGLNLNQEQPVKHEFKLGDACTGADSNGRGLVVSSPIHVVHNNSLDIRGCISLPGLWIHFALAPRPVDVNETCCRLRVRGEEQGQETRPTETYPVMCERATEK